jgi:hypothetical protein
MSSIRIIESILEGDPYQDSLPYIIQQKFKYLNQYDFFPAVCAIIQTMPVGKPVGVTLKASETFEKGYLIKNMGRRLMKLLP